ncbi:hypothetical protein F4776DRAFT_664566 [Hypoxylon sp. NC0597]|nr:hypothetical protein F4776DRAFT_664566 [Hypoxylon sp. NC0597]
MSDQAPTSTSTTQEEIFHSRQHEATTTTTPSSSSSAATTAAEEDGSDDAEGDTEDAGLYPGSIACPCPCHENTARREGRPWLAFSNEAYLVCPLCWVDAYMTAHGDEKRLFDCERYLRARGKDPKVPASKQC